MVDEAVFNQLTQLNAGFTLRGVLRKQSNRYVLLLNKQNKGQWFVKAAVEAASETQMT